jgi:hypothetical protein
MANSLGGSFLECDQFPFLSDRGSALQALTVFLRERWDAVCQETIQTGRIAELHAARDDIKAVFDAYLNLLKDSVALFGLSNRLIERNGLFQHMRDELTRATDDLKQLRDEIFANWQTEDDIGAVLVEKFPLSTSQLEEIAKRSPPPHSWYEETFDPFTPGASE